MRHARYWTANYVLRATDVIRRSERSKEDQDAMLDIIVKYIPT